MKLREKIKNVIENGRIVDWRNDPTGQLADQILALLPQWTKVEDGLPDIHGRSYWVHNRFGEHEAWFINNSFFLRSGMIPIDGVTHWQPLPPSPKDSL
jgi:hypothetical protein